jgi:tetratricopeptide (TPR) repeat protein
MGFLQHWSMRPALLRVRFERWDELLAMPEPAAARPHARALWHYARGRARLGRGDLPGAQSELEALRRIAAQPELSTMKMEFNFSDDLIGVAERVLTGRVEAANGRYDSAVEALTAAVRGEDALTYGEPPEWSVPSRLDLGEVLLAGGRYAEAERAFRDSLRQFPRNGWALRGLAAALRQQGREPEAAAVESELHTAWAGADAHLH